MKTDTLIITSTYADQIPLIKSSVCYNTDTTATVPIITCSELPRSSYGIVQGTIPGYALKSRGKIVPWSAFKMAPSQTQVSWELPTTTYGLSGEM